MTVDELIRYLQNYHGDTKVLVREKDEPGYLSESFRVREVGVYRVENGNGPVTYIVDQEQVPAFILIEHKP